MQLLKRLSLRLRPNGDASFHLDQVPAVAYLLQHRDEQKGNRARTRGDTPTASLYRMYEYFVTGFMNGLRTEIEYFFNKPWPVSAIPDPKDPDPQRYAILSVLPFYLTIAFNRLIERGLPRAAPAIITAEMEDELRSRPRVLEKEPLWVAAVPKLDEALVIPDHRGLRTEEDTMSARFRDMNIIAETPHVLFV